MDARVWMVAIFAATALGTTACSKDSGASDFQKQRENIVSQQRKAKPAAATAGQAGTPQADAAAAPEAAQPAPRVVAYRYDPLGKRDPFRSFVLERVEDDTETEKGPLERFELQQLEILGVVWKTSNRRALVADPSGQAYIVAVGDGMGKNDGRVMRIEDNLVLVKETYEDFLGDRTTKEIEMRVRQGQGG